MIIFVTSQLKPYDVTAHLNRLNKTGQMRDHNICFYAEINKNYSYHQILPFI